jgi:hypothetical protein
VIKRNAPDEIPSLISQMCCGLSLLYQFISNRSATQSVMLGTILSLLQNTLANDSIAADPLLTHVINKQPPVFQILASIFKTNLMVFGTYLDGLAIG